MDSGIRTGYKALAALLGHGTDRRKVRARPDRPEHRIRIDGRVGAVAARNRRAQQVQRRLSFADIGQMRGREVVHLGIVYRPSRPDQVGDFLCRPVLQIGS
jgi:hypothetical protein